MPNAALQRFRQILTGSSNEPEEPKSEVQVVEDRDEGPGISMSEAFSAPEKATTREPDAVEEETPAAEPEPKVDPVEEKLRLQAERSDWLERELEFLRRGQQTPVQPAQPAIDPVQQAMDMLRVDPETWTQMVSDPAAGAQHATNALQAAFLLAQRVTTAQLGDQFSAALNQRIEALKAETRGQQLNNDFWSRNPELLDYTPIVQHFAQAVASESDATRGGIRGEDAINEISRRTRAQLQSWGVSLEGPKRVARRGNLRPATADMGGGDAAPAPGLTTQQKHIMRMLGRRTA